MTFSRHSPVSSSFTSAISPSFIAGRYVLRDGSAEDGLPPVSVGVVDVNSRIFLGTASFGPIGSIFLGNTSFLIPVTVLLARKHQGTKVAGGNFT